jgi:hypothetical protein
MRQGGKLTDREWALVLLAAYKAGYTVKFDSSAHLYGCPSWTLVRR